MSKKGYKQMEEHTRHLIERFPERSDVIRSLSETNAKFKDLIADHHDVCEELARMDAVESEANPERRDELKRRQADLEEELMLITEGHLRT